MVEKIWLYAYVRTTPWTTDTSQKIHMQVTYDEGQTWWYLPKKKMLPLSATVTADYEIGFADNQNGQCTFFFPPVTSQNTLAHRTWIIKGT